MQEMLLATAARCDRRLVDAVLPHVRDVLDTGERYRDASPELVSLGIDVDAWPVPPAGLFVIAERTVYLRMPNPMTIAHELGHAFDCAMGGGDRYFSSGDPEIRCAYDAAWEFVTPYASVGLDEFVAEGFRAWIGVNDPISPWPKVTRQRLRVCSSGMFAWFERTLGLEAVA